EYVVHVTEEFLEFIADGALAIEVWGHRCAGNGRSLGAGRTAGQDTHPTRQGHSRRLQVCVKQVQDSGTLPLLVEAVLSVSIGCVSARSTKLQRA
uniref:kinesin-like protein KIF13A n=1 Tax=Oncorhynchus gorbuscha TaxID=8017 RepID=UPI001EAE8AB7